MVGDVIKAAVFLMKFAPQHIHQIGFDSSCLACVAVKQ